MREERIIDRSGTVCVIILSPLMVAFLFLVMFMLIIDSVLIFKVFRKLIMECIERISALLDLTIELDILVQCY